MNKKMFVVLATLAIALFATVFPALAGDSSITTAPTSGHWNFPGSFVVTNNSNQEVTVHWLLDCWDESLCSDSQGDVTLKPGASFSSGLGSICSKWQLDLSWDGGSWGGIAEKNPNCEPRYEVCSEVSGWVVIDTSEWSDNGDSTESRTITYVKYDARDGQSECDRKVETETRTVESQCKEMTDWVSEPWSEWNTLPDGREYRERTQTRYDASDETVTCAERIQREYRDGENTPELPPWGPSWPACDAKIEDVHSSFMTDWLYRCGTPVAPKAEPPCPTCPDRFECNLEPGKYVQVHNHWVGLSVKNVPTVFATEQDAKNSGLASNGSECGLCAKWLVNMENQTVFITEGATPYDIALALNLAEGSPVPNYLNRHMAAALIALRNWKVAGGKADGWYSYSG